MYEVMTEMTTPMSLDNDSDMDVSYMIWLWYGGSRCCLDIDSTMG